MRNASKILLSITGVLTVLLLGAGLFVYTSSADCNRRASSRTPISEISQECVVEMVTSQYGGSWYIRTQVRDSTDTYWNVRTIEPFNGDPAVYDSLVQADWDHFLDTLYSK